MPEILRQLGRYELLRRIAAGGMGEIFLARMRGAAGFEKRVIIKTILPHLAEEEEFITKFLDEGRIVVQLTHGNIVPVFDMGEQDGEYFLAMEYIPGRDLREVVKRLKANGELMPVEMALYLISEVCKGLDYAHRKADEVGASLELVHRDVSPSNVLISHEGEVKIIDFGIARATSKISRTVSGRIQGKFCYMSPEQASGKVVDARSDIFSTGVVLYELLTGMRPFEGGTDLESLELVRECEFDAPSTLNALIPPEVDAILARAMTCSPEARYESIGRMQTDLLHYLYSNACAPTSQEVAEFMAALFPEGIEHKDLRDAMTPRSQEAQARRARSLDDILDQEIEMIGGALAPVDPLTTTAPSVPLSVAAQAGPHTATLQTKMESPSGLMAAGEAAAATAPSVAAPQGVIERGLGGWPEAVGAPKARPRPQASLQSGSRRSRARTRRFRVYAAVVVLGVGVATGAGLSLKTLSRGSVHVQSAPAGARIFVDGALVSGATTPHTIELEPGAHTFSLQKQGYEETARFRMEVRARSEQTLEGGAIALQPKRADDSPQARRVRVTSSPPGAQLTVDGAALGAAPQEIELGEDVRVIYARHEGCEEKSYVIGRNFGQDALALDLRCEARPQPEPKAGREDEARAAKAPSASPRPERAKRVTLTIRARPEGARITIDGGPAHEGTLTGRVEADREVTVRVTKPGFAPQEERLTPSKLRSTTLTYTLEPEQMGCLNARVFRPQLAAVRIDGQLIGERVSRLHAHKLAPGTHTVHAVNELAGRDERYEITVSPGDQCAQLTIFGRE